VLEEKMHDIPFIGMLIGPALMFQAIAISAIMMPVLIVGIVFWYKARDRELQAHQELQMRQMEHERKMKEMEIEKATIDLEKAKASKTV
jgi:uncharacterized protein HemX